MLASDLLPAPVSSDVEERIRAVMAGVLELEPGAIGPGFARADSPAWDSLRHLRLVTALEAACGIRFTMREVAGLDSFAAICQAVAQRG
jgi:acyl carrier protein